ncbi:DUF5996 family protein [Aurantiacibacter aquimixticola]|uniref:Uncharacterized protein n=1 Tax=Aurantiacibacter aquimixticola TaxID=1958945 RepID=A0A419RQM6_9SPHN|nr:DUF5996 family protein [Aurantiacibacter aquimixticola]RJY08065.1 hypothetical protein D6201_00655 [Aurantiacibacter aquimixticola]
MTAWPHLDYTADRPTIESCHMVSQLVGKLPTRLHPWVNHGWHVALRVSPRGFVTRSMPAGDGRSFTVEIDMRDGCLRIACDNGGAWQVGFVGKTIAVLQSDLRKTLEDASLPAPLHGGPNEVIDAVLFARDDTARPWDADAALRLHGAFAAADRVFNAFRSLYLGKSSPSHMFWGSFDLAVTRFSGRRAPPHPGGFPNLPDHVTREAYSHEVISAGFWPGGGGVDEAAFYAYAYPSPDELGDAAASPESAYWHADLGEFVITYADVAASNDPDAALMAFLQSTYDAAAERLDWPTDCAVRQPSYGSPAQTV